MSAGLFITWIIYFSWNFIPHAITVIYSTTLIFPQFQSDIFNPPRGYLYSKWWSMQQNAINLGLFWEGLCFHTICKWFCSCNICERVLTISHKHVDKTLWNFCVSFKISALVLIGIVAGRHLRGFVRMIQYFIRPTVV